MALQLGALRDALIEAGATAGKADKAAEELAGYDNRLAALDTRLAVLTVMIAGLYAVMVPAAWLLVRIAVKTGAIG